MKLFRIGVAWLLVLGLSTAGFAGDLRDSIARATSEQAPQSFEPKINIPKPFLWTGAGLFVGGMAMALYGFLHTNGADFVTADVSKQSNTTLGVSGLVVAGLGGAVLFAGSKRGKSAPSITVGPDGVKVAKRISW